MKKVYYGFIYYHVTLFCAWARPKVLCYNILLKQAFLNDYLLEGQLIQYL